MTESPEHTAAKERAAFQTLLRERRGAMVAAVSARRDAEARAERAERELQAVLSSRCWRLSAPLRRFLGGAASVPEAAPDPVAAPEPAPHAGPLALETEWLRRFDALTEEDDAALRRAAEDPALPPLLIAMPPNRHGTPFASATGQAVEALRHGPYARWRLCLLPGSGEWNGSDPRVGRCDGGSDARVREGERLVLLLPGTLPRPHGLLRLAQVARDPAVRLAHADEDRMDPGGRRTDPFFKPRFSPELLRRMDYLGGLVLLGGARDELDAVLRVLADGGDAEAAIRTFALDRPDGPLRAGETVRVPEILSHDLRPAAPTVVRDIPLPHGPFPLATIIIPTRDRAGVLGPCLDGVLATTTAPDAEGTTAGPRAEIIVVDNGSTEPETLRLLLAAEAGGRVRVLRAPGPFNYSRLNNIAAREARGEVLVLLNNDTEVQDRRWLARLLAAVAPADVGAVGARLLYPDGTVQHGGIVLGAGGTVAHLDLGLRPDDPGHRGLSTTTREVSAVTGALLAIRREVYERLGGLDEGLTVAFNDVRLCLDALAAGYRNIRIAEPLMIHHEARTRGRDDGYASILAFRAEARRARNAHRGLFRDDPYHNPNLSLERPNDLARPPRHIRPSRRGSGRLRVMIGIGLPPDDARADRLVARWAGSLMRAGHEVILARPDEPSEPGGPGASGLVVGDAVALGTAAIEAGADWVVALGARYASVKRHVGAACRVAVSDPGVPSPGTLTHPDTRFLAAIEAELATDLADLVLPGTAGPALGNADLVPDPETRTEHRTTVRRRLGLAGRTVILVPDATPGSGANPAAASCGPRFAEVLETDHPAAALDATFLILGEVPAADLAVMAALGIVHLPIGPHGADDAFAAADIYFDLSSAPGRGVLRALAHGLPVITSDSPVTRGLPVALARDEGQAFQLLADAVSAASPDAIRPAVIVPMHEGALDLSAILGSAPG